MTRQTTLIHNQREIILYDLSKKYKIKHFSTSYLLWKKYHNIAYPSNKVYNKVNYSVFGK
jgi:hypothetical protein